MNLKNQFYKQRHLADSVHDMGCSQKAKKKTTETTRNREKNERNFCS